MYKTLQDTDLGPYLEFSPDACYYLAYEEEDEIAADLPVQTFNIRDVFYDMEYFIGQCEIPAVCHGNKVLFVEADRPFFKM